MWATANVIALDSRLPLPRSWAVYDDGHQGPSSSSRSFPPSRSAIIAFDRLESHRRPSAVRALSTHLGTQGHAHVVPADSTYLSFYQNPPVMAVPLARPVRVRLNRPWYPRYYPGYLVRRRGVGLAPLFANLHVTFPLWSEPPSTVPTGRRGLLSSTPTAGWVTKYRAHRLTQLSLLF